MTMALFAAMGIPGGGTIDGFRIDSSSIMIKLKATEAWPPIDQCDAPRIDYGLHYYEEAGMKIEDFT